MTKLNGRTLLVALTLLAACGEPDVRLPGERIGLRSFNGGADPVTYSESQPNTSRPISLPASRLNADWTHRGGSASHLLQHPSLGGNLSLAFRTDIGSGNSRRARITADPVVGDGRVFTFDSNTQVSAVSTAGAPLWTVSVRRPLDRASDASGGGLAYGGGMVYVTTGFGELIALDAATGGVAWRQDLDAYGGAAPTVSGDLVFVSARDGRAWAVERSNGRVRWTMPATPAAQGYGGGSGIAVSNGVAVMPFPSGEVTAAFQQGGIRRWTSFVAGQRTTRALSANIDISGDPVISGDRVYVGNASGQTVALDLATGDEIWSARHGAQSPVIPVGGSVFLVNDLNQLVRLDAATGALIWRTQMPDLAQRNGLFRTRTASFAHYGPVMAGGRLIVASSDGQLRQFDPRSGQLLGAVALPGGAATNPAVAGGILYVVNRDGELLAFR
ncbi:PQQ-binding-like beta-propeller repeat protein [Pelagovum pacificum]|uniref:Quinoprotein n=1 Tax=Pelagovum pacificum TaxID=2588711 RepID=A0A5C5GFX3_9RHOB|nr:PQQ-binding-like beta-propeller repeat protein [Pelagovum pacificum]QQA44436.1 PQQ-like beta-propeller repeat protein [Pelagovum pacificum]TNY32446.1 quinoprotein [Pelagovum pacificum]